MSDWPSGMMSAVCMPVDVLLISVDSDDYTLGQIMQMVEKYQQENPGMDVFLDGDRRAIMGRPRQMQRLER